MPSVVPASRQSPGDPLKSPPHHFWLAARQPTENARCAVRFLVSQFGHAGRQNPSRQTPPAYLERTVQGAEERGFKLTAREAYRRSVEIGLGQEKLEVSLEERIRQVRRQLTDEEKTRWGYSAASQKWTQEKVPTGELILKVKEVDRYGAGKEWRETAEAPIEEKLRAVIADIAGMFETIQLRRKREAEEYERRWKLEEERRLAEMERKREKIRYRRLIGNCEDWRRAADIRAFVAAVEESPLASNDAGA